MNEDKTGGPAFPARTIAMHQGMTLRDYFAAKAMQSLLMAQPRDWPMGFDVSVSFASYEMADAMLEAMTT